MDSVVQRLHAELAEALGRRRPDYETEPVTVAEVYQELVPYRVARTTVGFEMNADYEHALLRLLSGEGDRVRLEPEEVRDALRRELASPNPDVTLFRRYAACDVWVNRPVEGELTVEVAGPDADDISRWAPAWIESAATPPPEVRLERPWLEPEPEEADAAPGDGPLPGGAAGGPDAAAVAGPTPGRAAAPERVELEREMPPAASGPGDSAAGHCGFCRGALPADRPVRFCPFCGADQQLRPCARCGEVLERGWRYCVTCGAPAPEPPASA